MEQPFTGEQMKEQDAVRVGAGNEEFLTVEEAAKRLNMSTSWVYKAGQRGTLPCVRFGGAVRFPWTAIYEWARNRSAAAKR
jgi:excisionase family DNA binding protein